MNPLDAVEQPPFGCSSVIRVRMDSARIISRGRVVRSATTLLILLLVVAASGPIASRAEAAFPGANGRIAFAASGGLWSMNPDGSDARLFVHAPANQPRWSPDGRRVAYLGGDDQNRDIYVDDADTGRITRLTSDPGMDTGPAWSPDGQRIAFSSIRGSASDFDVYVVDFDGAHLTRLTDTPRGERWLTWSPDGTKLAFTTGSGSEEIHVINADGTGDHLLLTSDSYAQQLDWSPDGTKIAYVAGRPGQSASTWVMGSDGSDPHRVLSDAGAPSWSPDGTTIAFVGPASTSAVGKYIGVASASGSGATPLFSGPDLYPRDPAWGTRQTPPACYAPTGDTTCAGTPPPPPPPPSTTCPDVQVVAVRGSRGLPTDPSPLNEPFVPERATDPTIAKFVVRLMARLGAGATVDTAWIRYDAAWAVRGLDSYNFIDYGRTHDYNRSVDGGVATLRARLAEYQDGDCVAAGTQLVLAGYSQGAQIIGRAVDQGMALTRVRAVVLMGDPTFSADHSGDTTYFTTFGLKPIGALGAREHNFPSGPKVFSICRPRDAVCDGLGGTLVSVAVPPVFYPEHTKYRDSYTIGSGPWWSYKEQTFPPPTDQMADKVARQAISLPSRSRDTHAARAAERASSESAPATESAIPVLVLPERIVSRPGEQVLIPAALSYDPDGGALRYDWDLDGDGLFERTTTQPWLETSFPNATSATIAVRAVNGAGAQTVATSVLEVASSSPGAPSAPRDVRAVAGDHSVTLSWSPPSDTGGLPVTAYVLRDAATGAFITSTDDTTAVTLNGRDPGVPIAFTLTARNDARAGAPSAPTLAIVPWGEPRPQVPSAPDTLSQPSDRPVAPAIPSLGALPSAAQTTFGVTLSIGRVSARTLARDRRLTVACTLTAAGSCYVRATVSPSVARRLRIGRSTTRADQRTVGQGRIVLTRAGKATIRLKLSSSFCRGARQARTSFQLRLKATATNRAGASATANRLVRVRL